MTLQEWAAVSGWIGTIVAIFALILTSRAQAHKSEQDRLEKEKNDLKEFERLAIDIHSTQKTQEVIEKQINNFLTLHSELMKRIESERATTNHAIESLRRDTDAHLQRLGTEIREGLDKVYSRINSITDRR